MGQNFVAEVTLAAPIILGKRLVGDSWLAGIAYQQHGDWQRAIAELPIDHIEGIPQMSVALPDYSPTRRSQSVMFIRSFMRDLCHDPDMADMLDKMPSRSMLTPSQGPLSNISNRYLISDVAYLCFLGRGDIAKVEATMRDAKFMGSQKARGFGQIAAVNVRPIDTKNKWFGMVGVRNGRNAALRPIPQRLADHFPPDLDGIVSNETWHNPYCSAYANSVVEPCLVPPFMRGEGFALETDIDDYKRVN